jgi:hypothetical protein
MRAQMRKLDLLKIAAPTPPNAIWDGTIKTIHDATGETHSIAREFVSFKEAKEITGISDWTWREWAELGKCASVKLGHRVLIPVSELKRLLSEGLRPAFKMNNVREEGSR